MKNKGNLCMFFYFIFHYDYTNIYLVEFCGFRGKFKIFKMSMAKSTMIFNVNEVRCNPFFFQ